MTGRTTMRRLAVGTVGVVLLVTAPGAAPAQASGGLLGGLTRHRHHAAEQHDAEPARPDRLDHRRGVYRPGPRRRGHRRRPDVRPRRHRQGVGVALVDTGVVPVAGLTSGNVVNGPDLSFESQSDRSRVPRHLRSRHTHGRHHRRRDPSSLLSSGEFQRHRSRRPADQPQGRHRARAPSTSPRSSPRSTGSWRTATTTRPTRSGC